MGNVQYLGNCWLGIQQVEDFAQREIWLEVLLLKRLSCLVWRRIIGFAYVVLICFASALRISSHLIVFYFVGEGIYREKVKGVQIFRLALAD